MELVVRIINASFTALFGYKDNAPYPAPGSCACGAEVGENHEEWCIKDGKVQAVAPR